MTTFSLPLEVHGPHGVDGGFSALPFLGYLLLLAVLAGVAYHRWRAGYRCPDLGRRPSPEDEAKRILADRLARGDLSTDEFMERTSIVNWTPGSDAVPTRPRSGGGEQGEQQDVGPGGFGHREWRRILSGSAFPSSPGRRSPRGG